MSSGAMILLMESPRSGTPTLLSKGSPKFQPRTTRYRYIVNDLPPARPPPMGGLPTPPSAGPPRRFPSEDAFSPAPLTASSIASDPPSSATSTSTNPPTRPPRSTSRPTPPAALPRSDRVLDGTVDSRRRSRSLGSLPQEYHSFMPSLSSAAELNLDGPQRGRSATATLHRPSADQNAGWSGSPERAQLSNDARKSLRTLRRMSRSLSRLRTDPEAAPDLTPLPPVPALPGITAHSRSSSRDDVVRRPYFNHSRNGSTSDVTRSTVPQTSGHARKEPLRRQEDVEHQTKHAVQTHRTLAYTGDTTPSNELQTAKARALRASRYVPPNFLQDAPVAPRDDSAVRQIVVPPTLRRVSRSFTNLRLLSTRDAQQAEDQVARRLQQKLKLEALLKRPLPTPPTPLTPPTPDHFALIGEPRRAPSPPSSSPAKHAHKHAGTHTPSHAHKHSESGSKHKQSSSISKTLMHALHFPPPKPAPIGEQPVPASRGSATRSRILSAAAVSRMKAMSFAPSRPRSGSVSPLTVSSSFSSSTSSSSPLSASSSPVKKPKVVPGPRKQKRGPLGLLRGLVPDLDVVVQSPVDPVAASNNRISFLAPAMVKPYMGQRI